MKTVWIIDHYSSEPKYGGISRQYDFGNELANRGYNVVIISSLFSHFTHKYIKNEDIHVSKIKSNYTYVYVKTTPYSTNGGKDRLINMLSFHKEVVNRMDWIASQFGAPDVVNGCSVHPFAWTAAYKVSTKFNSKFCVEVRDLWPEVWVLSGGKSKYHPMVLFTRVLEKWIYKKADAIIYSMSKGNEYISGKLGIDVKKTFLVGQPMDCERFDNNAISNFDLLPLNLRNFMNESFVCSFAGYYMDYEGIFTMLQAAKKIQDMDLPIKMIFVGSGQEENAMIQYVQDHNLKNVYIGGRISKEAVPSLLTNSDIVMAHLGVENHKEAYKYGVSKNKVNEYLYSGAVTLYGFHDKKDAVAISGGGYIFEPFNSEELTDYILKVFKMEKRDRNNIGELGKKYIRTFHESKVLTAKLESIFFD